MITKQDLDAANREAEQAHENAERFRTPVRFTQEQWNQALENVIKLQADLANAEQECADLKAKLDKISRIADSEMRLRAELGGKLAQVEADAAVMREALNRIGNMPEHRISGHRVSECPVCLEVVTAIDPGVGQALLDELATLRETAKRRLELLRKCEWEKFDSSNRCPICIEFQFSGHNSTCPLAAELKATP